MIRVFLARSGLLRLQAFTPSLGVGLYHVADPSLARDETLEAAAWVAASGGWQYTLDGGKTFERWKKRRFMKVAPRRANIREVTS